jgi:hypothetical protein
MRFPSRPLPGMPNGDPPVGGRPSGLYMAGRSPERRRATNCFRCYPRTLKFRPSVDDDSVMLRQIAKAIGMIVACLFAAWFTSMIFVFVLLPLAAELGWIDK